MAAGIRRADHVAPTIRKSWHLLRRQAAVAWSVALADSVQGVQFFLEFLVLMRSLLLNFRIVFVRLNYHFRDLMSNKTKTKAPQVGHAPHGKKHYFLTERIQTLDTRMPLMQTAHNFGYRLSTTKM
jgi:hypothetical protein